MFGTFVNVVAVILGSIAGILFGARLSDNLKNTIFAGLGLFTAALGVQMFLKSENALIVLGSLIIGAMLGEWWALEERLHRLGAWLEQRFMKGSAEDSQRFVRGFLTASVLYCIGPMAVMGALSDGLTGDSQTLIVKSIMDGLSSIAFASTLGVGVAFSALPILILQGGISLLAGQLNAIITPAMLAEMTATGGVLLVGISFSSLLEIKKIRVANFLPALFIAPLAVYLLGLFIK
jgi:uncharacterized membrane protein YqgA involved in biofilm formation